MMTGALVVFVFAMMLAAGVYLLIPRIGKDYDSTSAEDIERLSKALGLQDVDTYVRDRLIRDWLQHEHERTTGRN